jgi:hypothetical protein
MALTKLTSIPKRKFWFPKTVAASLIISFGVMPSAHAFLGGLTGLLDTIAPVLSDYGLDITKYAGYLNTFQNVLTATQQGGLNNILGAVGSLNQSIGDAGLVVPSKLASGILDSVTANYSGRGGRSNGVGITRAQDRALLHAQNVSTRAYIESVLGEEGQGNIKKGVQGSGDLVKSASEIATKGAKSNVSQKKLDAIAAIGVVGVASQAQIYGKLTEIQINGVQQTQTLAGLLEATTNDRTAKILGDAGSSNGRRQAGSVFAGLAGPTNITGSDPKPQVTASGSSGSNLGLFQTLYEPDEETTFGATSELVPASLRGK